MKPQMLKCVVVQWKASGPSLGTRDLARNVQTTAHIYVCRLGHDVHTLLDYDGAGVHLSCKQQQLSECEQQNIRIHRLERKVHAALVEYMHPADVNSGAHTSTSESPDARHGLTPVSK
jgi:hypothetical protein